MTQPRWTTTSAVPARSKAVRRGGFSLIEVMLGMLVLVVAVLGTLGAITSSAIMGEATMETSQAYRAAQSLIERLAGMPLDQVFFSYNADTADDLAGVGLDPGANFAVVGLDPLQGDADGFPGQVILPASAGAPGVLREDLVDADLGLPRDLNADGVVDAADHSGDYVILPVRVRVEWNGTGGPRFVEMETVLGAR